MPLQSGDDGVLTAMNRWYDTATYLRACEAIRDALDRPAFTADVIVGFPGEDDAAFANTLETVRAAGFTRMHVFPFSARPGTAAAGLGAAPPPEAVRERRAALSEVAAELGAEFRRSLDGARETVVLEGTVGLSGRYQRVVVPMGDDLFPGDLTTVRLEAEVTEEGEVRLHGTPLCREEVLV